jgi:uncharacterized protein (TIGR02217 family)
VSITVYNDVILPASVLSAGVRGKNARRNTRTMTANGQGQINVDWSRTLREYQLGIAPMPVTTWQTIEGLHEVTEGGAYGFLMQDPKDSAVAATEGLLYPYNTSALLGTNGLGYGIPAYKMYKRYTSVGSTRTKDRSITRPQTTPVVKRGGSTVTHGAGAGNIAINYDTGTVTFVADSSSTVTAVSVGATTQVTLTAALSGVAIGERLYLSGLTGTVASTLNSLSHAITNITGGGLNVYTLSVVTTGLAWSGSGSGYAYPQSTETLTWSGNFYVPVHFANDEIDWELVKGGPADGRYLAGPSVTLLEVRE